MFVLQEGFSVNWIIRIQFIKIKKGQPAWAGRPHTIQNNSSLLFFVVQFDALYCFLALKTSILRDIDIGREHVVKENRREGQYGYYRPVEFPGFSIEPKPLHYFHNYLFLFAAKKEGFTWLATIRQVTKTIQPLESASQKLYKCY